ncbi:hypothetical protein P7D22_22805, partial [Lichenihabitans sp. Uapishka_5]|uniref:hypothetical protein n=1 Tax=Lichenihabitans sp. Uapishka_5 TaxID=3037302 RepID=UPI0029E7D0A0
MPDDGLYQPLGQPAGPGSAVRPPGRRWLIGLGCGVAVVLAGTLAWRDRSPTPDRTAAVSPI